MNFQCRMLMIMSSQFKLLNCPLANRSTSFIPCRDLDGYKTCLVFVSLHFFAFVSPKHPVVFAAIFHVSGFSGIQPIIIEKVGFFGNFPVNQKNLATLRVPETTTLKGERPFRIQLNLDSRHEVGKWHILTLQSP